MAELDKDTEILDRRLCLSCIGESFLRREIERLGETRRCNYCGETEPTLSISEVADYVDTAFEQHYRRTATEPSSFEYAMIKEGGYFWDREGEQAIYAIASAAEIDEKPAEDIRQVLEDQHFDLEMAQMGEENPFAKDAHYTEKEPDDFEYRENWRYFETSLKTEARFLSAAAEATLDDVFQGLADHRGPEGKPVIVEVGPEAEISSLYRARVFQSAATLEQALGRPDLHTGPPPAALANAGRMNAHGISVFYGATSPSAAISEVRPPVGSRVILGEFGLLRNLSLLDVNALQSLYVEGSVFDGGYVRRLERAKFLERLSELISRPVMPDDEPLEYLVTQVIADYLAARSDPSLDGILYPSVQDGASAANVMLFHKASRVELLDVPDSTEIKAWTGHHAEDGWETDYDVWEEVPPQESQHDENEDDEDFLSFTNRLTLPARMIDDYDIRDATLRLHIESLKVHHVHAARYTTTEYPVSRRRTEKRTPPF